LLCYSPSSAEDAHPCPRDPTPAVTTQPTLCSTANPAWGQHLQASPPTPAPKSTWHEDRTQAQKSGGEDPNAALHLGAARLPLVGQEFDSEGCSLVDFSWQSGSGWVRTGVFSAEKITARCGAKCQSFLYL